MRKEKPRAVVVMFGGNDDHGFMTGLPEGREVGAFGTASWTAEYRRRVAAIMDIRHPERGIPRLDRPPGHGRRRPDEPLRRDQRDRAA